MEHNTCRENLSAYLDGELKAEEKISLESHLASCAACAGELAELKKVSAIFRKHAMQPVPAVLKEEVFAQKSAAPFFAGWLKPAVVLSAAAAGLLVVLVLPKARQREQQLSPALFTNSYDKAETASVAAMDKSIPAGPAAPAGYHGEASGAKRYATPSFNKRGAHAQAKFAVGGTSGGAMAVYRAGAMEAKPDWVEKIIQRCQAGPAGNPPYTVWRYSYKGKTVYYLPPQCCDQYSELYDEAGKLLCAPDGGMAGTGDGKCPDFYKLRTDGKLVWHDARAR